MIVIPDASAIWWDEDHEEARFHVTFEGESILCRVTRELIEDRFGDPRTPEQCLHAARANMGQIENRLYSLLAAPLGRQPDGSIIISSSTWPRGT